MGLKVGIIGCGGIAAVHARGYRQFDDVEIVGCADVFMERAMNFAATHEIARAYDSIDKLFAEETLDAVSVCTPNYAHRDPTITALEAGIHVLCEKPIAMNRIEAAEMVEAAKASKALLSVGQHMRFTSSAQYLKRLIDSGDLGKIYFGRSQWLRRRGVPGWGQFHIKEKSGGGPLIDLGVHTLDLLVWLMGSPTPQSISGSVYTKLGNRVDFYNPQGAYRREDYDVEDFACGLIKFDNGATLSLEASWAGHLPAVETHEQLLLGERGGATINPTAAANDSVQIFQSRDEAMLDIRPHGLPLVDPHMEELMYWVQCVRGEREVLVKPEESLGIQRIIDGLYYSSETGREVLIGADDVVEEAAVTDGPSIEPIESVN